MIIRQNREKSRKNLNDSFDSVSNEISNPSKSSSLEREKNTVDAIEADKRSSLEERRKILPLINIRPQGGWL